MKKRIQPMQVRLPIPLREPVGLGELLTRATTAVGIKPCEGCKRRARVLDRIVTVAGRKR
jgi:hypothetical protein